MNNGAKFNIVADENGAVTISTDESRITIHPDGSIAISSHAPLQLTGASLAKLDKANLADGQFLAALQQRLPKKTSN